MNKTVGDTVLSFTLLNSEEQPVELSTEPTKGRVALVFYRGYW